MILSFSKQLFPLLPLQTGGCRRRFFTFLSDTVCMSCISINIERFIGAKNDSPLTWPERTCRAFLIGHFINPVCPHFILPSSTVTLWNQNVRWIWSMSNYCVHPYHLFVFIKLCIFSLPISTMCLLQFFINIEPFFPFL